MRKQTEITLSEFFDKYGIELKFIAELADVLRSRIANWMIGICKPRDKNDMERINRAINELGRVLSRHKIVVAKNNLEKT